ncbi:MAG: integration host factor subunit beta [Desulfobacterales bacterium]|nr:integration host factor subunit beta [Desulfobacterales bacterium]
MNKLQLIEAIRTEAGLTKTEAQQVIQTFFDEISDALAKGDRVEIRGLCSFKVKHYPPYTGRNPRSGEKVTVPEKRLPFFKPGLELKERVDGADSADG